jgi:hypothetical protein
VTGHRLLLGVAVLAAPLAWVAQLVLAYSFEESACAPGDGDDVWGIGVHALHIALGAAALAVAVAGLGAALALGRARALETDDRGFLASFALVGAVLFAFTIVLTGVGTTVLGTCHRG